VHACALVHLKCYAAEGIAVDLGTLHEPYSSSKYEVELIIIT
jgi:hypothetical protein